MGDPLADPRAARLLAADPGEVSSLAGAFRRVASQAEGAASGLRGASHDATWTGQAADAFRTQLGKLPGDLERVQRSYGDVASALDGYEGQLSPLRSRFITLADQIRSVRGNLAGAQGALSTAEGSLTTATKAPHATSSSPGVVNAKNAVSTASGTVTRLQGELSGLEGAAYRVLDEFDTARGHAGAAVSHAAAVAPSESWLAGALSAVGNFVEGVGKGILKSAWDLISGKALVDFIEHPSWSTFGELVKDVAVVASLVALVAAPFAAPELAEADAALVGADGLAEGGAAGAEGAAAGAEGAGAEGAAAGGEGAGAGAGSGEGGMTAGSFARGATTWGGRVSTGATGLGAVSDGAQGHWGAAALDVGFMAAPNLIGSVPRSFDDIRGFGDVATNLAGIGDHSAQAAAAQARGMQDVELLESWGLNRTAAVSLAFDKPPALFDTLPAGDSAALHAAVAQAKQAEVSAAERAMHIGRPAGILFDNLITDPSHDALNHKLHLTPSDG